MLLLKYDKQIHLCIHINILYGSKLILLINVHYISSKMDRTGLQGGKEEEEEEQNGESKMENMNRNRKNKLKSY